MTMPVKVRDDMTQRHVVRPGDEPWRPSPAKGVERRMLDRIGAEVARATTIVRYEPGSRFDAHRHDHGEEFLVLEGTFCDEHGEYPAGTYVRNPPGSSHAPFTEQGCTIFVKLRQFDPEDTTRVVIDTAAARFSPGLVPGLSVLPLHQHKGVNTALVRWAPQCQFQPHMHWGGEEILVLEGTFRDEHGAYPTGTWLRSPHLSKHTPYVQEDGCLIYVKVGHLAA